MGGDDLLTAPGESSIPQAGSAAASTTVHTGNERAQEPRSPSTSGVQEATWYDAHEIAGYSGSGPGQDNTTATHVIETTLGRSGQDASAGADAAAGPNDTMSADTVRRLSQHAVMALGMETTTRQTSIASLLSPQNPPGPDSATWTGPGAHGASMPDHSSFMTMNTTIPPPPPPLPGPPYPTALVCDCCIPACRHPGFDINTPSSLLCPNSHVNRV